MRVEHGLRKGIDFPNSLGTYRRNRPRGAERRPVLARSTTKTSLWFLVLEIVTSTTRRLTEGYSADKARLFSSLARPTRNVFSSNPVLRTPILDVILIVFLPITQSVPEHLLNSYDSVIQSQAAWPIVNNRTQQSSSTT